MNIYIEEPEKLSLKQENKYLKDKYQSVISKLMVEMYEYNGFKLDKQNVNKSIESFFESIVDNGEV